MTKSHLDNEGCRFVPHVVLLKTSQTLEIGNKDEISHNAKGDSLNGISFNPNISPGGTHDVQFKEPERAAVPVKCGAHPWMTSWVVVDNHPYAALTDTDGFF